MLLPIMPPYGSLLLQRWSSPGVYEVRGAVRDVALNQSAEIVRNAPNSAFPWYEIDSDASTRGARDHTLKRHRTMGDASWSNGFVRIAREKR